MIDGIKYTLLTLAIGLAALLLYHTAIKPIPLVTKTCVWLIAALSLSVVILVMIFTLGAVRLDKSKKPTPIKPKEFDDTLGDKLDTKADNLSLDAGSTDSNLDDLDASNTSLRAELNNL